MDWKLTESQNNQRNFADHKRPKLHDQSNNQILQWRRQQTCNVTYPIINWLSSYTYDSTK